MITMDMYKGYLNNKGRNLSEVRKNDSAMVMNATFTGDVGYKRVYLLDPEQGWIWTDAKYSEHSKQSIAKDDVDYYLQFRPFEHHPVGTYVFIPNDTSPEIGFAEDTPVNPFKDANFEDIFNAGKLWMLVDRNNATEFVRYMCLPCNWDLKWITKVNGTKRIMHVYGIARSASSYTAGIWQADVSVELDQITGFWMPDVAFIFGEKYKDYNLDDTRYFVHDLRVMLTTNKINPKCYKVTKINELAPKGIFKCIVKQDEFDERKDNVELMVCNYYDEDGDVITDPISPDIPDPEKSSEIFWAKLNENNELVKDDTADLSLSVGVTSYFMAEFSDDKVSNAEWRVSYVNVTTDDETLSDERKSYYCGLLKITDFGESIVNETTISSISLRPNKVKQLIGKKFLLEVQNHDGEYASSIELEVKA